MKTKEVAQVLGTTPNVVTENGKKLFPNKEVQRGKAVDWTEEEVTVLIDHMQKNPSNNAGNELISSTYRFENTTSNAFNEGRLQSKIWGFFNILTNISF